MLPMESTATARGPKRLELVAATPSLPSYSVVLPATVAMIAMDCPCVGAGSRGSKQKVMRNWL